MILQNLHTHSVWDDGKDTLETMVRAAIAAGLTSVGFSGHGPLPIPNRWAIPQERLPDYHARSNCGLKEAYAGQIDVYCGLNGICSARPPRRNSTTSSVPFTICPWLVISSTSTTVQRKRNVYSPHISEATRRGGGSVFFAIRRRACRHRGGRIVGIRPDYEVRRAARLFLMQARPPTARRRRTRLKTLVDADKIFEINTGAISRGFRTSPTPPPNCSASSVRSAAGSRSRRTRTARAESSARLRGGAARAGLRFSRALAVRRNEVRRGQVLSKPKSSKNAAVRSAGRRRVSLFHSPVRKSKAPSIRTSAYRTRPARSCTAPRRGARCGPSCRGCGRPAT